jgi:plasmid stabilization system protein ParE
VGHAGGNSCTKAFETQGRAVTIVWAEAAVADLIAVRQFITDHNPDAANATASRILKATDLLNERPHLGLNTHLANVRRLIVSQSPYSMFIALTATAYKSWNF